MIFWATVLSFIVGLLSYMMYPRNDKHITEYLPASEAYIASFVTQHQAAKDYLREALIALQKMPDTVPVGNVSGLPSGKEGSVLILSPELDADGNVTPDDSSEGLLPFLPEIQAIMPTNQLKPVLTADSAGGYVSVLGCFSYPERRLQTGGYMPSRLEKCTSEEAETKYVFTYGPLPDIDQPLMRKNILLWEAAILKRTHGNPDCGFLQKKGNRYFINTSSHLTRTIPAAFANILETSYMTVDAETNRVIVGTGDFESPLLFCMTPANDPYPRKGMVLNLDSIINTGIAGQHATSVDEMAQKWANLATPDSYAEISNGYNDWHILDNVCQNSPTCWEKNDKGFTFGNDRYIKTGIEQSSLGNAFTISMALYMKHTEYNQTYSLFGSKADSCTPETGKPCLYATMHEGNLTITLKESNTRISTLASQIPSGSVSQIDYILSQGSHRLIINGKEAARQKFSGTTDANDVHLISQLANSPLLIGWDGVGNKWPIETGILYNFLIYKRATMDDPAMGATGNAVAEQFDVRGLPRIYRTNSMRYDN